MKNFRCTGKVELKASTAGKPRRFAIMAYNGGILPVDGFPVPVVADLAGLEILGSVPILIDHEKSVESTLGITDDIINDGKVLTMTGLVTATSAKALTVVAQADKGHQWQASIGARVLEQEEIPAGKSVEVNGQTFTGPVIVARRSVLYETSVLPAGADSTTQVNLAAKAATLKGASAMTFEDWLKSIGVDMSTLSPEGLAAMQLAYESANKATPAPAASAAAPAVPPVVAPTAAAAVTLDLTASISNARKQHAAEMRRVADIQAKAAGYPNIAATAIEEGWSSDKVELEVLKASQARTRPTSFSSAQNTPENLPQVLEAAVCMTRKISGTEKAYDDKTLQAAHGRFRRGIGLQELLIMAAVQNGMSWHAGQKISDGNLRDVLAHACPNPRDIKAAFSTLSLPGILSNVANKEILEGYMEEDSVWKECFQTKSTTDFKTVTSYRLLDNMEYEKLGPGGTIKHGTVGEESFTRSVDTYAKMFSLTRRDIINDDMGAFDDLRGKLGMGSAIKLNDLIWTTFLANLATIFTSGRTNYISGATTNLGTDGVGLGLAQKAWRSRTSPTADGGKRLGGQAKFLLVPPELETIADALYATRNIAAVKVSDANTFANKYQPIVANQLSDSAYTGYSATHYFLMGDKSRGTPLVVSFLNGQQTPTVESADASFDTLGIEFRGYHDFGVDLGDGYMNAVMSKGSA